MQDFLPLITGGGGALVVLALLAYLFITGRLHSDTEFQRVLAENEALQDALDSERIINTEMIRAGGVTNSLIGAVVDLAHDRHAERQALRPAAPDVGPTAEDLGLRP